MPVRGWFAALPSTPVQYCAPKRRATTPSPVRLSAILLASCGMLTNGYGGLAVASAQPVIQLEEVPIRVEHERGTRPSRRRSDESVRRRAVARERARRERRVGQRARLPIQNGAPVQQPRAAVGAQEPRVPWRTPIVDHTAIANPSHAAADAARRTPQSSDPLQSSDATLAAGPNWIDVAGPTILLGLSGAGFGLAGALSLMSASAYDDARSAPTQHEAAAFVSTGDQFVTLANGSLVLAAVIATGAATWGALTLSKLPADPTSEPASIAILPVPDGFHAGAHLRF